MTNSRKVSAALHGVAKRVAQRDSLDWAAKSQLVIDSAHPKQRAAMLDPGRRVSALCSRGAGKTTMVKGRLLLRSMNTIDAACLFVATTRDQAIDIMWDPLKDSLEQLNIRAKFNETRLECRLLDTGARIRLVGADDKRQIEKYRGIPHHEVWVDEAASYPIVLLRNLIHRVIAPRLGDYDGMLGLCGTPGHILNGEFYEATRPGGDRHRPWEDRDKPEFKGWKSWSSHYWNVSDGAPYIQEMANLWREYLIEKEAQGWSDTNSVWLREYMGQWAADDTDHVFRFAQHDADGNDWNIWTPEIDPVTRLAKLPEDIVHPMYVYGMDFGHTDPTALEVFAYSMQDPLKRLFHVYEFVKRGMYLRQIAELLLGPGLDADNPGGVIGATGWPTDFVADPKGLARGYIEELRQVYGVRAELADQAVEDGEYRGHQRRPRRWPHQGDERVHSPRTAAAPPMAYGRQRPGEGRHQASQRCDRLPHLCSACSQAPSIGRHAKLRARNTLALFPPPQRWRRRGGV